jgi:hypothetical protein
MLRECQSWTYQQNDVNITVIRFHPLDHIQYDITILPVEKQYFKSKKPTLWERGSWTHQQSGVNIVDIRSHRLKHTALLPMEKKSFLKVKDWCYENAEVKHINKMVFNIIDIRFHWLDQIQSDITVLPLEKQYF